MDALDNLHAVHPFVDWCNSTKDGGYSQHFSEDRFLDLMIINFENAASHKYVVQKAKGLWTATSEMTGHSFLVLIQNDINSVLKILGENFCL